MSANFPKLPPLVAEDFKWHTCETDSKVLQRRAVGAEVPNGSGEFTRAGANDLYLSTTIQFDDPSTSLVSLKERLKEVLPLLRFQHPEIGCTYFWDGDKSPYIQYRSLRNHQEAVEWADEIVHVRAVTETGLDIRDENQVAAYRLKYEGVPRPIRIYLVASVPDIGAPLGGATVEVVFRTNHLSSDGISIRIVVGDIIRMLGSKILSEDLQDIGWGDENKNLAPSLLSVLGDNQAINGDEFESSSVSYMGSVSRIMTTWKLKQKPHRASPRTLFHTFSLDETDRMIRAVKTRIGSDFSITHLGHAAVLLAFLKYNPPDGNVPDDQNCVVRSPMNARRFLQEDYSATKPFYPVCLAMAPIVYENIKSYNVVGASQAQIFECLVRACKVTKDTYDKWLELPSLVPLSTSFFHLAASLVALDATPSPTSPFFVSDDINERYIPREVRSEDQKVLTVQDIRFFTNMYSHLLVFRLDSWRDRLTLSLNYNDGNYTKVEAAEFLQDAASFMLAISE